MDRKFFLTVIGLLAVVMNPGCATIFMRSDSGSLTDHVYPARAFDAQCFWECGILGKHPIAMADPTAKSHPVTRVGLGVGSAIDLPFSIVADTVLLPVDVYRLHTTSEVPRSEGEPAGDEQPAPRPVVEPERGDKL